MCSSDLGSTSGKEDRGQRCEYGAGFSKFRILKQVVDPEFLYQTHQPTAALYRSLSNRFGSCPVINSVAGLRQSGSLFSED